jgi:hypothetical protein
MSEQVNTGGNSMYQNQEKIVLVPERWMNKHSIVYIDDLCPPEWIRIPLN